MTARDLTASQADADVGLAPLRGPERANGTNGTNGTHGTNGENGTNGASSDDAADALVALVGARFPALHRPALNGNGNGAATANGAASAEVARALESIPDAQAPQASVEAGPPAVDETEADLVRVGPAPTGLAALVAQRLMNTLALRIAPAAAAGLIASSGLRDPGTGLIVFACVLAAAQLIERSRFPLDLMPAARVLLGVAAPLAGTAGALLILAAAGSPYTFGDAGAILLGSWLVLALGAWIKARLTAGIQGRIAVIGSRDFAADLAHELAAAGIDRYRVVGWIGTEGPREYRRLSWLGPLSEVREVVLGSRIELLVCDPGAAEAEGLGWETVWGRVADACLDLPVGLIDANQLYEETLGHVPVGMIDAAWYRYIMHPRFRASAPISKRVFDLVGATVIGVLFLPVLVVAAIAIKLEDRGPILYRQRRLGEHGREFEMLKLRTMGADADDGTSWADPDDAKITRVGGFLRRRHLNELPQLWNILRGDMTLVGPRPELPEMVALLERKFPHYTRRHLVKPGVAGWAALRCGYAGSDLGAAWTLCHDLFYIKRRSLLTDALILAETAVEVFRDAHRALRAPSERFLLGDQPNA